MKGVTKGAVWLTAVTLLTAIPAVNVFADPPIAKSVINKPTNAPPVPRAIPQLTPYWDFDPPKHPLFDISRFTVSGDMRVRPEMRSQSSFGVAPSGVGRLPGGTPPVHGSNNDFYVQQWMRLGLNYAVSPDVDVFFQPQWSKNWGAANNTGINGAGCQGAVCGNDAFNVGQGDSLFARQAFIMIRNLGIQNLSLKAGRQLIVMGNHRLFGHFDWANTGFSHDGVTLQYSQPTWEFWGGWVRPMETDFNIGSAAGGIYSSSFGVVPPGVPQANNGGFGDDDLFFARLAFKPMAGLAIEPLWVFQNNNARTGFGAPVLGSLGLGQGSSVLAAHANGQRRHTVGARVALRKGIFDGTAEGYWQFGDMSSNQSGAPGSNNMDLRINAYALAAEAGLTFAALPWTPRVGVEFNYASGDGDQVACANSPTGAACNGTSNTFENLYPTNHIIMGYADVMAWRNMVAYSASLQLKPSEDQHLEFRVWNFQKAVSGDCWYRAAQNCYFTQTPANTGGAVTSNYLTTELDAVYTLFFKEGKVAWQTGASYLFAGSFLDQIAAANNPGAEALNQTWAYTQLHVNF